MSTLILTTCDSGAGHLKHERIADRVLSFTHHLVTGPIPAGAAPESFFQCRRALYGSEGLFHAEGWFVVEDGDGRDPHRSHIWSGLPEACREHDQVELWIDPDPNAQLVLLQLLDWLTC